MKIRQGFVSNSSSSSFIVYKNSLSDIQLNAIRNAERILQLLGLDLTNAINDWTVEENDDTIKGYTMIDNFDFIGYLNIFNIHYQEGDY